ncbi:MAG: RNA 2',3'-cyclic phosphodiesterase [Pseudomonadota bacterium]
MRLFVGLALPDEVRWQLEKLASGLPGARWVVPENYHLTLRFIGEVGRHDGADIDSVLSGIAPPAFDLQLHGLGQFGDRRSLRALWAGVRSSEGLAHLQAKVEQGVQRSGQPPETRKFKPHVTLARFKQHPGERLAAYLTQNALFTSQVFQVSEFCLFSSQLGSEGAVYHPEAHYPLRPPVSASAAYI